MNLSEISQIVSGLVVTGRCDALAVNVSSLEPPYDKLVSVKASGGNDADLITAAGMSTFNTAKLAALSIPADSEVGTYLNLLHTIAARTQAGNVLARLSSKMLRGEDVDVSKIQEAVVMLEEESIDWMTMDEVEAEENVWIPTHWSAIDDYMWGMPRYGLIIVAAPPGCITGDTIIDVNRAGKSFKLRLDALVDRFNGGRCGGGRKWDPTIPTMVRSRYPDGSIRLNQLARAIYSGKKETYRLLLSDGKEVTGTWDHPILTPSGWVKLTELQPGMEVYVDGGQSTAGRTQKQTYPAKEGLHYHLYAGKRGSNRWSVPVHRLAFEAGMNGMTLDAFIEVCRTDEATAKRLLFLDPYEWAVHHIDRDAQNNDIANLRVMTHHAHRMIHAGDWTGNVLYHTTTATVISVEAKGEQDTYDLSLVDEPRNFIANGIVVHNTGKTSAVVKLIDRMTKYRKRVGFVSLELTKEVAKKRWLEIRPTLSPEQARYLHVTDLELNLNETCASIARLVSQYPDIYALFIDYADLMLIEESTENASKIYIQLSKLAKKLRKPIFLISQLSRNYVGGVPHVTDIRYSGLAEAAASMILLLYNPDQLFVDMGKGKSEAALPYVEGAAYIIEGKSRFGYKMGGVGAVRVEWGRASGWAEEGITWDKL